MGEITIGEFALFALEQLDSVVGRGAGAPGHGGAPQPPAGGVPGAPGASAKGSDLISQFAKTGLGASVAAVPAQLLSSIAGDALNTFLTKSLGPGGLDNVGHRFNRFFETESQGGADGNALLFDKGVKITWASIAEALRSVAAELRGQSLEAKAKEGARERTLAIAQEAGAGGIPLDAGEVRALFRSFLEIDRARLQAVSSASGYISQFADGR